MTATLDGPADGNVRNEARAKTVLTEAAVPPYAAPRRFAWRLPVHSGLSRERESTHSFPLSTYSAPGGGLRQDPGRAAE
jgi:hypothetical protein